MTIYLLFIANNKLVARVKTCASSFGSKILDKIAEEELEEKFTPIPKVDGTEDETFPCREFIEKVWDACVRHGYLSQDFKLLRKLLDTLKIEP